MKKLNTLITLMIILSILAGFAMGVLFATTYLLNAI